MSAHMKKHLTSIKVGKEEFKVPKKEAAAVLALVKSISLQHSNIPADVIYKEFAKNRPKGAIYLRGLRSQKNMSQKDLEKLTSIPLSNISKYESGSRKITPKAAKKLAKALGVKEVRLLA